MSEKVYVVEASIKQGKASEREKHIVRAKSKAAALKKVLQDSVSVRLATVDDLFPPSENEVQQK